YFIVLSDYYTILSFANLSNNCFCPNSLKKIVAFISGRLPSRLTTFPKPNRSCSTSIPTCKEEVSEGAKPAVGTCALGNMVVVLTTFGLGFENDSLSFCFQATRSDWKLALVSNPPLRVLKSSSKQAGLSSSKKRLGSQLLSVPQRYRDVA